MGKKLDAAITNLQDFVLDRLDKVMTELEVADLTGRILTLTDAARFPFELEILDMGHGVVITIPDQYSVEEVINIKRSFVKLLKSDTPVFVCRGGINIQKLHADLVIAAQRFVERCYACRGTGVVVEENEGSPGGVHAMNCGVCADLRAALSFFDKHNIPYSREKATLPSKAPMFHKRDKVLYVVGGTKPESEEIAVFISYLRITKSETDKARVDETDEWQPLAKIALDGYVEPQTVSTSCLYSDPSSEKDTLPSTVEFRKGDPVLYKGNVQAVFGWYLHVSKDPEWSDHPQPSTKPQPQCVVFMNAHPSHERMVLTKDLHPWVHSSHSMPTAEIDGG